MSEGFTRHDWTEERPGERVTARQGAADVPPPRSGYPLPGCSSAEPGVRFTGQFQRSSPFLVPPGVTP